MCRVKKRWAWVVVALVCASVLNYFVVGEAGAGARNQFTDYGIVFLSVLIVYRAIASLKISKVAPTPISRGRNSLIAIVLLLSFLLVLFIFFTNARMENISLILLFDAFSVVLLILDNKNQTIQNEDR